MVLKLNYYVHDFSKQHSYLNIQWISSSVVTACLHVRNQQFAHESHVIQVKKKTSLHIKYDTVLLAIGYITIFIIHKLQSRLLDIGSYDCSKKEGRQEAW